MNELCKDSRYIGGVFYCCDESGDHEVHVAECNPDITWENQ